MYDHVVQDVFGIRVSLCPLTARLVLSKGGPGCDF
jgi:hypothetical protein